MLCFSHAQRNLLAWHIIIIWFWDDVVHWTDVPLNRITFKKCIIISNIVITHLTYPTQAIYIGNMMNESHNGYGVKLILNLFSFLSVHTGIKAHYMSPYPCSVTLNHAHKNTLTLIHTHTHTHTVTPHMRSTSHELNSAMHANKRQ